MRVGGERADDGHVGLRRPIVPVASEKIVSPSPGVCDGVIARAIAVVRHLRHLLRLDFRQRRVRGDDADRRVLAGTRRSRPAPPRSSLRTSASVPSGLRAPATTLPDVRIDDVADGVHRDDGGDDESVRQTDAALPIPAFIGIRGVRADPLCSATPPILPTVAPAPAPTLPSATGSLVADDGRR